MIATGNYRARGIAGRFSKSPEKGTPCVEVDLRLEEGPDKGAHITWVGWLTDGTIARTAEALGLMGADIDDLSTVGRQEVVAAIEHETFTRKNGEQGQRPRVAWINDPKGGGRMEPLSAPEISGVKERLKAAAMAARAKAGAPPAAVNPDDEPRF